VKKVLVTGGLGYVGSHCCVTLLAAGYKLCIVDNLSKSRLDVLVSIEEISKKSPAFHKVDINNYSELVDVFKEFMPDVVIHAAGLKSVTESAVEPLNYYEVNVMGTINLLKALDASGCKRVVFSSSATVYGKTNSVPIDEGHKLNPESIYGKTKLFSEQIINDWVVASEYRSAIVLRYFNPIGAHSSGLIFDNPLSEPTNIMPLICKVAIGDMSQLKIFGTDYQSRDGTGERDYIHIEDVASAHLAAVDTVFEVKFEAINLSTGRSTSVFELIEAFENINGVEIETSMEERRPGDVAVSFASNKKAYRILSWRPIHNLDDMVSSSFNPYIT
jgi:UDP-glucose 4-epimerase